MQIGYYPKNTQFIFYTFKAHKNPLIKPQTAYNFISNNASWVLPKEYPIRPTTIKNGYYQRNTHLYLFLPFKTYNLQNDGSILVQTPLSFNWKK